MRAFAGVDLALTSCRQFIRRDSKAVEIVSRSRLADAVGVRILFHAAGYIDGVVIEFAVTCFHYIVESGADQCISRHGVELIHNVRQLGVLYLNGNENGVCFEGGEGEGDDTIHTGVVHSVTNVVEVRARSRQSRVVVRRDHEAVTLITRCILTNSIREAVGSGLLVDRYVITDVRASCVTEFDNLSVRSNFHGFRHGVELINHVRQVGVIDRNGFVGGVVLENGQRERYVLAVVTVRLNAVVRFGLTSLRHFGGVDHEAVALVGCLVCTNGIGIVDLTTAIADHDDIAVVRAGGESVRFDHFELGTDSSVSRYGVELVNYVRQSGNDLRDVDVGGIVFRGQREADDGVTAQDVHCVTRINFRCQRSR